ncbi:T9SS type A sorting domain-containing protein [Flavobacterium lindanitolerans]|nr:T9SS type A sorting domain-containing protein [Flavobacterium lindanitolerans]
MEKSIRGYGNDLAQSVQQTADGGYIVFGYVTSNDGDVSGNNGYMNYWIVKLSSQGVIQWQKALGGSNQEGFNPIPYATDGAHSIQQTTDLGYILAGYSKSNDGDVSGNHGGFDYWVVKLANPLGTDDFLSESISVYPNPASERVFVHTGASSQLSQLSLYDLLGQHLRTTKENSISVSGLSQGVYLLQIKTDKGEVTKKMVVE